MATTLQTNVCLIDGPNKNGLFDSYSESKKMVSFKTGTKDELVGDISQLVLKKGAEVSFTGDFLLNNTPVILTGIFDTYHRKGVAVVAPRL